MPKRSIDTNLPNKRWYRELAPEWKVLWIHLTLMCDHAGILDVDIPMWNIRIGEGVNFTEKEILEVFSDRIYPYKKHKWYLIDFIDFQQGYKNIKKAVSEGTKNIFYNSIINRLESEGLTRVFLDPSLRPIPRPSGGSIKNKEYIIKNKEYRIEDKDIPTEEKKTEKEDKKISLKRNVEQFELIWESYPKKRGKKPAGDKYKVLMPDEDLFNVIFSDVTERAKSHQWRKEDGEFVPLMTTYLNQERWNDEMYPVDAPENERFEGGRKPYIEEGDDEDLPF